MLFDFELTGHTPLLMHADDMMGQEELAAWRKDPDNKEFSVKGDDRSPPWTWITYLHHDTKNVVLPADVVMATLREAGKQMVMKGNKTFKGQTQSGLFIQEEFIPLSVRGNALSMKDIAGMKPLPFAEQASRAKDLGFALFGKRGSVNSSKHYRVRPRFDVWSVKGQIEITDEVITEQILGKLFEISGKKCGFLDWRPNAKSPGRFGQFTHRLSRAA